MTVHDICYHSHVDEAVQGHAELPARMGLFTGNLACLHSFWPYLGNRVP